MNKNHYKSYNSFYNIYSYGLFFGTMEGCPSRGVLDLSILNRLQGELTLLL